MSETTYTFPGWKHEQESLARMLEVNTPDLDGALDNIIASKREFIAERQRTWDEVHSYSTDNPDYVRLRDAIWKAFYPDCPYWEEVQTWEIASMRRQVHTALDAVWAELNKSDE